MRGFKHLTWTALVLLSAPAGAAVLHVPGEAQTIAQGVAAASPGDTVVVACGTYVEHDVVLDREITLRSETGDPACVVIDAASEGRVFMSEDPSGEARIVGITVTGGLAAGPGPFDAWGGGMLFIGASPTLVECRFTGNSAARGGGLMLGGHGSPTVAGCTFSDNAAELGGGAFCFVTAAAFTGCTFLGNAAGTGGAIYASLSTVTIGGSTFHGNSGAEGSALFGEQGTLYTAARSIISFGLAGEAVSCDGTSEASLSCCDVYGNAGGDWVGSIAGQDGGSGNFAADPRYCDAAAGDLGLRSSSPCLPDNQPGGEPCGLIGAHEEGCEPVLSVDEVPCKGLVSLGAWPNPFEGSLEIVCTLPSTEPARLGIYDVGGRLVRSLEVAGPSGTVRWDGADEARRPLPAGAYYLRVEAGSRSGTRRVLLLR